MMKVNLKLIKAIKNLNREFRNNHKLKIDENKIRIGRSHSLSYVFEREIALVLAKIYPSHLILVDYPITLLDGNGKILKKKGKNKNGNKKNVQPIYPDILVVKGIAVNKEGNKYIKEKDNGIIEAIFDLKLDLGHVNTIHQNENLKLRESLISNAKSCKFKYIVGGYDGEAKKINKDLGTLQARFKEKLKRVSLVCTSANHSERKTEYIKMMKEHGYEVLFLLDEKTHPNTSINISKDIENQIKKNAETINNIFKLS
jgi:hypothetical protein